MGLQSALFSDDDDLQACLVNDRAHVTIGAIGDHVTKIHSALTVIEDASIDIAELNDSRYGPSTAAAVLAYKRRRQIINYSYQTQADDIVGKMTIAAMDREMSAIAGGAEGLSAAGMTMRGFAEGADGFAAERFEGRALFDFGDRHGPFSRRWRTDDLRAVTNAPKHICHALRFPFCCARRRNANGNAPPFPPSQPARRAFTRKIATMAHCC
jgi:hypothetical protein